MNPLQKVSTHHDGHRYVGLRMAEMAERLPSMYGAWVLSAAMGEGTYASLLRIAIAPFP